MQRTAWLLAFVVGLAASVGTLALTALSDRAAVLAGAEAGLAATARLLEAHADRALEAGQRAVQAAVEAVGDPATLRAEGRAQALHDRLSALVEGSPQLASIWVMDAEGYTVAENWAHPPLAARVSRERDYFQAHLQGERGGHVGSRSLGAQTGRPRFTLSRPLLTPEGRFAGVVAAGVMDDYFASVYAEAGLGPEARFALFRTDGAPLVVWPWAPGGAAPALPAALPPPGGAAVEAVAEQSLRAVRNLARFPVVLVVTQPLAAALAEWRLRTQRNGLLTAGFVATLAALTAFGLRGARQEAALTEALRAERGALERRVAERTAALAESEARFREMADTAPMMVWVADTAGACTYRSRSWHAFTGQAPDAALGHGWLRMVHPEDRDRVAAEALRALRKAAPFRLEYRLRRADGAWRWALDAAAPRLGPDGRFRGHVGSVLDITDRHEAEERQTLMARELDHRAKNALAVVQAALRLTPKDDPATYARAVEGRVAALARAHSLLAQGRWQGVGLRDVAAAELAAFLPEETDPGAPPRAVLDGPDLPLSPGSVQALSMALHELATNATKYGALGAPGGSVALAWSADAAADRLVLRWAEKGGPALATPPDRRGFGSRVIESTVAQLGGRVERRWEAEGLCCRIELPLSRVLAAIPAPAGETREAVPLAVP